jgi:drug/metabolite transporter (DMT)-like permease
VVQVVWARFFFHVIFVAVLMGRRLPAQIRSRSWPHQGLRSLFMFMTTVLFFVGLSLLAGHRLDRHVHVADYRHYSIDPAAR